MDTAILLGFGIAFALSAFLLVVLPFSETDVVSRAIDWLDDRTDGAFSACVGMAFMVALMVWLSGPSLLGPVAQLPLEVAYTLSVALLVLGAVVIVWSVHYEGFTDPYDDDAAFVSGVIYCVVALLSALITGGVDALMRWLGG